MTQVTKHIREASKRRCCRKLDKWLDPELFKALGDPNRIDMLVRLSGCRRACTVSEIATCFDIDLSVVSRHLKALRQTGVLTAEKRGKEVYYAVNYQQLAHRLRTIADAIEECCLSKCC